MYLLTIFFYNLVLNFNCFFLLILKSTTVLVKLNTAVCVGKIYIRNIFYPDFYRPVDFGLVLGDIMITVCMYRAENM